MQNMVFLPRVSLTYSVVLTHLTRMVQAKERCDIYDWVRVAMALKNKPNRAVDKAIRLFLKEHYGRIPELISHQLIESLLVPPNDFSGIIGSK